MNIAFAAKAVGSVAVVGGGAYGVQQWQSGARRDEQVSIEELAVEAESTGRPKEAAQKRAGAPSDRERDWDKFGITAGIGTTAAVGGLLGPFADMMSTTGAATSATRGGLLISALGVAAIAGTGLSVYQNKHGRFG